MAKGLRTMGGMASVSNVLSCYCGESYVDLDSTGMCDLCYLESIKGQPMKNIIICDIDGTLCTDEHRNYLLQCEPRKWDEYFDLCHLDQPVEAVVKVLRMAKWKDRGGIDPPYKIHLMTARVDTVRQKTIDWLKLHNVPYDTITFRPADSRVQDNVLKTMWANELGGPDRVLFVLEDRQRVVDAWRQAGYTCFQVAPGNF